MNSKQRRSFKRLILCSWLESLEDLLEEITSENLTVDQIKHNISEEIRIMKNRKNSTQPQEL